MKDALAALQAPGAPPVCLYSIGHSRHPAEQFLALLRAARIELLADVRSQPASRWAPQFTRARLEQLLHSHGLEYAFLGRELGGRAGLGVVHIRGDGRLEPEAPGSGSAQPSLFP